MKNVPLDRAIETGLVLANAAALIIEVLLSVAGDDMATHIQGESIYESDVLSDTVVAHLQSNLTPHLK